MIKAQSADGMTHEVPDGTPMSVVDNAMAEYATQLRLSAADNAPSTAVDVAKGTVSGLAKGGALAIGAPNEIAGLVQGGVDWTRRQITGKTEQQEKDEAKATVGSILDRLGGRSAPMDDTPVRVTGSPNPASAENLTRLGDAGMGGLGPSYQPHTTLGRGAKTLAEHAPGALIPGSALQRGAQVVLPAAGSEGGKAVAGAIGGVAGGVIGSLVPSVLGRDPYIARRLGRAASGVTEQQFDDAARLAADARQRGVQTTAPEAIISQAPQARGRMMRLIASPLVARMLITSGSRYKMLPTGQGWALKGSALPRPRLITGPPPQIGCRKLICGAFSRT
jgi:hypothetical protein